MWMVNIPIISPVWFSENQAPQSTNTVAVMPGFSHLVPSDIDPYYVQSRLWRCICVPSKKSGPTTTLRETSTISSYIGTRVFKISQLVISVILASEEDLQGARISEQGSIPMKCSIYRLNGHMLIMCQQNASWMSFIGSLMEWLSLWHVSRCGWSSGTGSDCHSTVSGLTFAFPSGRGSALPLPYLGYQHYIIGLGSKSTHEETWVLVEPIRYQRGPCQPTR